MDIKTAHTKYAGHKNRAKRDGIEFLLTFDQWLTLWQDRLDERGRCLGQYVMCRKDDRGPYAVGNCYIATGSHNSSVRGFKETRTHALDPVAFNDFMNTIRPNRYGVPLAAMIAAEEAQDAAE